MPVRGNNWKKVIEMWYYKLIKLEFSVVLGSPVEAKSRPLVQGSVIKFQFCKLKNLDFYPIGKGNPLKISMGVKNYGFTVF